MKYAEDLETIIKPFISRQGGSKAINQIDLITGKIIKSYPSAAEAARSISGDSSTITKVCKGKLKSHKGYMWAYVEV